MFITKPISIEIPAYDAYLDGGTKVFKVLNSEEVGIKKVYQDFRLQTTSQGKYYTAYPGSKDSTEIIKHFIHEVEKE